MHRTQPIIEDWQYEYLKSISEKKGKSLSEIVKEIITAFIEGGRHFKRIPLGHLWFRRR